MLYPCAKYGGNVAGEISCKVCKRYLHIFCTFDDGVDMEDRTEFFCPTCAESKNSAGDDEELFDGNEGEVAETQQPLIEDNTRGIVDESSSTQSAPEDSTPEDSTSEDSTSEDTNNATVKIRKSMTFGFGDDMCDVERSNLGPNINGWVDCSGIQLSHLQMVIKRLEGGDPVRKLFELFLPKSFWDAILQWTNDNL